MEVPPSVAVEVVRVVVVVVVVTRAMFMTMRTVLPVAPVVVVGGHHVVERELLVVLLTVQDLVVPPWNAVAQFAPVQARRRGRPAVFAVVEEVGAMATVTVRFPRVVGIRRGVARSCIIAVTAATVTTVGRFDPVDPIHQHIERRARRSVVDHQVHVLTITAAATVAVGALVVWGPLVVRGHPVVRGMRVWSLIVGTGVGTPVAVSAVFVRRVLAVGDTTAEAGVISAHGGRHLRLGALLKRRLVERGLGVTVEPARPKGEGDESRRSRRRVNVELPSKTLKRYTEARGLGNPSTSTIGLAEQATGCYVESRRSENHYR